MGGLADIQLGCSFATRVTNSRVAHQLGDTYATALYTAYNAVGHGYPRADTWNATKMTITVREIQSLATVTWSDP